MEASLDDDKAESIVVIDLSGKTDIADYMVVASGTSQRHIGTMATHLREKLRANGFKGVTVEGESQSDWVLIDAGDILVHLFRPDIREFYGLEKLWGDSKQPNEQTQEVLA
ncbi:MAG: ribosome silencing factor [Rhodospirillales bacterium]